MLDFQSQQWSLGILAVDQSSAFLQGLPQNAGSFHQGTVQWTRRRAVFCTNRFGVHKSDPRLRPACSKPHISRTCLDVKVVAAENVTIKRCRCHVMANLITVLFGGVDCRQGSDLSVIFIILQSLRPTQRMITVSL